MIVINGIAEEALIQRFIEGDQTAFELLFRFYYPGLVIYASKIIFDYDEAEEIVQDFFVKIWSDRNKIKKSKTLKNYFFRSVKNRAINYLKREKVSQKVRQKLVQLIEKDKLFQPDFFIESELQTEIKSAFQKLTPRANEIFTLSRFHGLTNTEIAEQLNISKRTVETHISNALKILREELKDFMFLLMLLHVGKK